MNIITCPKCKRRYRLDNKSQQVAKCNNCGEKFSIVYPSNPPRKQAEGRNDQIKSSKTVESSSFQLSVGKAAIKIPPWFLPTVLITLIVLVALISFFPNLIKETVHHVHEIYAYLINVSDPDDIVWFQDTAVFFAPLNEKGDQDPNIIKLEKWLVNKFEGFSRWQVHGKYKIDDSETGAEDGYFYQASLPGQKTPLKKDEIAHKLNQLFGKGKYYILNYPSGKPTEL